MFAKRLFRIILVSALVSSAVSCSKTENESQKEYSKELAEGKPVYITSSKAGEGRLENLRPFKATLSMSQLTEDACELSVLYEFAYAGSYNKNSSISLRIPAISVVKEDAGYSLDGTGLQGECSFKGETHSFSDAEVKGVIGFDGNASLDISGIMGGMPFSIKVLETSVDEPEPQEVILVDYLEYCKINLANVSSSDCDVKFNFRLGAPTSLHVKSGDNLTKDFWTDGDFWTEQCVGCQELSIDFGGGHSTAIPGSVIWGMKEGSKEGVLKCLGKEPVWYLRANEGALEPARYLFERYEISDL